MPSAAGSLIFLAAGALCSLGLASPRGDEAALVQAQVRLHGHQGRQDSQNGLHGMFSGVLQGFREELSKVVTNIGVVRRRNNVDPGTYFINRTIGLTEADSSASFVIDGAGRCATADRHGTDQCTLRWGENMTIRASLHVASGLQPGDTVINKIVARFLSSNQSHPVSKLITGSAVGYGTACKACYGSCITTIMGLDGDLVLEATAPTVLDDASSCVEGHHPHDINFVDGNITLPAMPDPAMQLSGHFLNYLMVVSENGTVKVNEVIEAQFTPGPSTTADLQRQLAGLDQRKPGGTLPEMLDFLFRQRLPAVLKEAHKPSTVANLNKLQPWREETHQMLDALILNLEVSDLEDNSGHNISLSATGCTPPDSMGSTSCKIPFGTAWNLTMGLQLDLVSEEGSFADLKVVPKVGGMLGLMVSSLMQPIEATLPLCGREATFTSGAMTKTVDAGKCGFHSVRLIAPTFQMFLEDFSLVPLQQYGPMLPTHAGNLPPASVGISFGLKHANNKPIANVKLEVGLGYL